MEKESSFVVLPKISNQSNPCDSDESDDKVTAIQNNVNLSQRLDHKSLAEKMSYIWNEWTCKKNFYDLNSKGSFLFKFFLWGLR